MALALVLLGLYAVWFPAETHASTPLVLSLGWAALLPFAWRRGTKQEIRLLFFMSAPLFLLLILQVWRSPDRCQGIEEVFLLVALFALSVKTGRPKWVHHGRYSMHISICIGDGKICETTSCVAGIVESKA